MSHRIPRLSGPGRIWRPCIIFFLILVLLVPGWLHAGEPEYSFSWETHPLRWDFFSRSREDSWFSPAGEPAFVQDHLPRVNDSSFRIRKTYRDGEGTVYTLDFTLFPGTDSSWIVRDRSVRFQREGISSRGFYSWNFRSPIQREYSFTAGTHTPLLEPVRIGGEAGATLRRRSLFGDLEAFRFDTGEALAVSPADRIYRSRSLLVKFTGFLLIPLNEKVILRPTLFWSPYERGEMETAGAIYRKSATNGEDLFQMDRLRGPLQASSRGVSLELSWDLSYRLKLGFGWHSEIRNVQYSGIRYEGFPGRIDWTDPDRVNRTALEMISDVAFYSRPVREEETGVFFRISRRPDYTTDIRRIRGYRADVEFPDGSVYTGFFKEDQFHGNGKLVYPDGSYYRGDWLHGKRDGYGVFEAADGDRYEGDWKDDHREGMGTLQLPDGTEYEGGFHRDMFEGAGILTYPDGEIEQGFFHEGILVQPVPVED